MTRLLKQCLQCYEDSKVSLPNPQRPRWRTRMSHDFLNSNSRVINFIAASFQGSIQGIQHQTTFENPRFLSHQKELLGASASHLSREHSQWAQNTVCSAPQHSVCVWGGGLLWRKNSNISTRLWVSELASPANLVPSSEGASAEEPTHIRLACSSLGRNKEGSWASPGAAFLWGFYFKLLLLRFCLSFLQQWTVVCALRQTLYSPNCLWLQGLSQWQKTKLGQWKKKRTGIKKNLTLKKNPLFTASTYIYLLRKPKHQGLLSIISPHSLYLYTPIEKTQTPRVLVYYKPYLIYKTINQGF